MTTTFLKTANIRRNWHLVDAKNQTLGRLATQLVRQLNGKSKSTYAPHIDGGDFVVVINAEDIKLTGTTKATQKIDFRHSGYPGGDTSTPYSVFLKEHPERAISLAVAGMLPKNRLRKRIIARLKVYRNGTHPHGANFPSAKAAAQEPVQAGA